MKRLSIACAATILLLGVLPSGCVRAARDTSGFAIEHEATVEAPFDETWQAVKSVLRQEEFNIFTRDKRGTFVVYTEERRGWFKPRRTKYTIDLAEVSKSETHVRIEAVRQHYGVTPTTYPGWHDRPTDDQESAEALLSALLRTLSGDTVPVEEAAESG